MSRPPIAPFLQVIRAYPRVVAAVRRTRAVASEDDERRFARRVGAHVRSLRLARGLTQAALASAADLSPNFVARVERGELGLSLFVAHRLARTLETELTALLVEPKPRAAGLTRRARRPG